MSISPVFSPISLSKTPMKTTRILSLAMTMAMGMIAALQASVTEHQPPAPLPEFKTPAQLAKWRADQSQKTQSSAPTQEGGVFYTGKPYLAESGSYAFKYREYNPEMGRWTTVDPSGFPDGANNRMYAAIPTSQMDNNGLELVPSFSYTKVVLVDKINWAVAVSVGGVAVMSDGIAIPALGYLGVVGTTLDISKSDAVTTYDYIDINNPHFLYTVDMGTTYSNFNFHAISLFTIQASITATTKLAYYYE